MEGIGLGRKGETTPWITEGRVWHLEKRCGPKTKELLLSLDKLIQEHFEVDGPIWNQKYYVAYRVNNYNWLCVHTKPKFLLLDLYVRTKSFDVDELAQNLSIAKNEIHISTRCCELVRENPSKELEKALNADVKILGLKADESRARARLWTDHGDYYFVKRYFGRNRGIWKANPISIWTESDIWRYHKINAIPHCKLYDMGHTRNGCWPCAMGVRNGQLKRLRESHPKLFRFLVLQTEMGKELFRTKLTVMGAGKKELQVANNYDLSNLIEQRPCFFDSL